MYAKARDIAGGTDEKLFADYFDSQYDMLRALKPPVVGHFDLIRLKSDEPDKCLSQWPSVWGKVTRNLDFIAAYGGIVELNFASLRKGLREPYPGEEICKAFLARHGRFCLSDDSHGVEQVALNYQHVSSFLERAGISTLHYLSDSPGLLNELGDSRFPHMKVGSRAVTDLGDKVSPA